MSATVSASALDIHSAAAVVSKDHNRVLEARFMVPGLETENVACFLQAKR